MAERKPFLLRLDPEVHKALERWAGDELRSVNGQLEYLLRRALRDAGRSPGAKVARVESPAEPGGGAGGGAVEGGLGVDKLGS